MKNKTLTKAQAAKLTKLHALRDEAADAIYAAAPNPFTPFLECFQMASTATKTNYEDVIKTLREFEEKMIDEGRGRRNTFGSFCQYY